MFNKNLELILNNLQYGILTIDDKGIVNQVNKAFIEMFGRKKEYYLKKHIKNIAKLFLSPKEAEKFDIVIKKYLKSNKSTFSKEIEITNKEGKKIAILHTARILVDDDGKNNGILISFRKMKEESFSTKKLIRNKELYTEFLNSFDGKIIIFDKNLNVIDINEIETNGWELKREDVIGKNIKEISALNLNKSDNYNEYLEIMKTGKPRTIEELIQHPKYGELYIIIKTFKLGDGLGMVLFDNTKLRRIELEKQKAMRDLDRIFNLTSVMICISDDDRFFKRVNKAFMSNLGYTEEELLSSTFLEFVHPEDIDATQEAADRLAAGERIIKFRNRYRCKDGSYKWIEWTANPVLDDTLVFNVAQDITKRVEAEEKLRKYSEDLEVIVENRTKQLRKSEADLKLAQKIAHIGNWIWDPIKNTVSWSDEIYRIFGLKPQEFGATYEAFLESVHPDDRESVKEAVNKALYENEKYEIEHRIIRKDGTERTVFEQGEVIFDKKGKPVEMVGTVQDITEKKLLEQQITKQEKLALLGRLVGGIGHELRNPLSSIRNAAYFLKISLDSKDSEIIDALRILEEEVDTSEKIINNLLGFASSKPLNKLKVDINELIKKTLTKVEVPNSITIETKLNNKLSPILADANQLIQVFINIINNGIQAIEKEGKVIIKTTKKDSKNIIVEITDTGEGMSKEVQAKIFEPLFTTKTRGIGLGLVITKTIIEKHKGEITIDSEKGKGSTVSIELPIK